MGHIPIAALTALLVSSVACQSSSAATISSVVAQPSVAPGYNVRLVASGLQKPRGIIFDSEDNLLVVEQEVGVTALSFQDAQDNSVTETGRTTVIQDDTLNHGIELSPDGNTLYVSSTEAVYSYDYDGSQRATTSDSTTLVTNMTNSDHTTRTLLLSTKMPGMLVVTRGSTSNIDFEATLLESGHSQIKVFNLENMTGPYDFNSDGLLLGWGLRNDVGIAEEPMTGGLYSVENSVDQMERMGVDIHSTNPGEELNYLGTLIDNQSPNQGSNFGYPECYAAWDTSVIPDSGDITVGSQFAIGEQNSTSNDDICRNERTAPRLVFESHMAPLDIKFNPNGTEAWVTFHGSWNRAPESPSGYKVSVIPFANGEPVAASDSTTGYVDIVSNQNNDDCPDQCFRPVGLAWDSRGRLFFSSDATGEIYMITSANAADGSVQGASPTVSASTPEDTNAPNSAMLHTGRCLLYVSLAAVAVACFLL